MQIGFYTVGLDACRQRAELHDEKNRRCLYKSVFMQQSCMLVVSEQNTVTRDGQGFYVEVLIYSAVLTPTYTPLAQFNKLRF